MVTRRGLLVLGCSLTLLAGCGGSSPKPGGPRVVTTAEANRLAIMRFIGYEAGGQHFHTTVSMGQQMVTLDGDVDYRTKTGYAEASLPGQSLTLQWTATTLLAWQSADAGTTPPATLPAAAPTGRKLNPTGSDIDAALALVLQFGQDRPDNAQLITQDGARFLRSATVGGTAVDVLQGPRAEGSAQASAVAAASSSPMAVAAGSIDYFVDTKGHLLRVDAALGGSTPSQIMLTGTFRPFMVSPLLSHATPG